MKKMLYFLTILLGGIFVGWLWQPAAAQAAPGDFEEVDAYVEEAMRRLPISGLALAIVEGDQIVYLKGYGEADETGRAVTPQTPFMMASVTKSFTALGIRQLAAAGKLDVDARLQSIVPEFQLANREFAAGITIRDLLEHTSGISTLEGTQPYVHDPATTFGEAVSQLAKFTPRYAPGEHYEYSNWNYVLLGEVIAQVSGQPYAVYMQDHILDPLQMTRSSFEDYHSLPEAAQGQIISFGFQHPYDEKHVPVMLSAGYLTASVEDMAHYVVPFFNQGQYQGASLLPPQGQGWYDGNWEWHAGYPGDGSIWYSGAHNSINTSFVLFSMHKVGVVVLMNTRLDALIPGPTAGEIAYNIGRIVTGSPYELPSNRIFYGGYAVLDGLLLILTLSILWQGSRLSRWVGAYRTASTRQRAANWLVIGLDLLLAAGIFILPSLLNSQWRVMLAFRTDVAGVLLALGILLAAVGVIKIFLALNRPRLAGDGLQVENRIHHLERTGD